MVKIQVFWGKKDLRQSMLVSTLKMKGKHARLSKADKITVLFLSFKFVLIVNVQVFPPFQRSQNLGNVAVQFNFEKKILPTFCFHKYCVVVSVLIAKEHYEETVCHLGYIYFYMTIIWV